MYLLTNPGIEVVDISAYRIRPIRENLKQPGRGTDVHSELAGRELDQ
jgi:hypothetical protein